MVLFNLVHLVGLHRFARALNGKEMKILHRQLTICKEEPKTYYNANWNFSEMTHFCRISNDCYLCQEEYAFVP